MTTPPLPPNDPSNREAECEASSFGDLTARVSWTSPPVEILVDTVPGCDWNATLTEQAQLLIAQLIDEAGPIAFTFDVEDEPSLANDLASTAAFGDDSDAASDVADAGTVGEEDNSGGGAMPCYFAHLPGTVRWTNDGIWVGVHFSPGEDWRAKLRQAAVDEAFDWTHQTAEHDVDFRLDMDYRLAKNMRQYWTPTDLSNATGQQ